MGTQSKEPVDLSSLLDRAGVNLTKVARALGKRHATVSDWRHGRHVPRLTPLEYQILLDVLQCTPGELAEAFPDDPKKQKDAP